MSFSRSDLDKLLDLISKGDIEALKAEEFDQFQYQGFDPMRILQSLMKTKQDLSVSDDDFTKDVIHMVAIGIIKGSVNDHNITKMSDTGKESIDELIKKYGIQKGGGRGKSSGVITFPRVMATFPDVAVRMTKVIGAKEFNGGPMMSSRLPTTMKVQVFPAVIPRGLELDVKRMLMNASLCYTIDQSTQISQMKDPDVKQLAEIQGKFTIIGHQSPVPGSAIRMSVFSSLKLEDYYEDISSVLKTYIEKIDPSYQIPTKDKFIRTLQNL